MAARCSCRWRIGPAMYDPAGASQSDAAERARADFGEAVVVIDGVKQKAHFFCMVVIVAPSVRATMATPHGDACHVRAYPAATAEAWVDGHVHAFAFFGRVPVSVLYDNDRCLVARILPPSRQHAPHAPAGQWTERASVPVSSAGSCRITCSATATVAVTLKACLRHDQGQ